MLNETLAVMVYFLFLVFHSCAFCAALCTLNCVVYHECASRIIDVGLHAVRCIMHPSRGLCTCIIYAVRDDVYPVFVASMICESVAVGINDLCCILLTMECA